MKKIELVFFFFFFEENTHLHAVVHRLKFSAHCFLFSVHFCLYICVWEVLFIWALRHPASGYVQGMNDLMGVFIYAFVNEKLREHCNIDTTHPVEEVRKALGNKHTPE